METNRRPAEGPNGKIGTADKGFMGENTAAWIRIGPDWRTRNAGAIAFWGTLAMIMIDCGIAIAITNF